MLSFYLTYRIHTLQVVVQHCNYLQFKNAREMPSVCRSAMKTLKQENSAILSLFNQEIAHQNLSSLLIFQQQNQMTMKRLVGLT